MSTSSPPSYEEAMKELAQLKSNGINPSLLKDAYAAMAEKAANPATTAQLLEEIRALSNRTIAINDSFTRIQGLLSQVDTRNHTYKDGRPLEKLEPIWVGFRNRFISLLWKSRSAATANASYVSDFVEVLLPSLQDASIPIQDKKAEFKSFIARVNPTPLGQNQPFATLYKDIEAFTAKFIAFADDKNIQLTAQIKALNDRILVLNKEIADCDKLVLELSIVLGTTGVAAGAAIGVVSATIASFGPAAPGILLGLVMTALGVIIGSLSKLISALNSASKCREERDAKQIQVNDLTKQLQDLQALKSALTQADQDLKQLYVRLDNFADIWSMVAQDAQFIYEYLTRSSVLDETMSLRVQLMESAYKAIGLGLREYATRVSNSGLPAA